MSDDEVYDWDQQLRELQEATSGDSVAGIQKAEIAEWALDESGIAMKGCAVRRVDEILYGLIIARRDDVGDFEDPRNLTREQLQTIHDFIGFMLEDSED